MSIFPIEPQLEVYRGSKENLRRRAAEKNATRHRVAEHVNRLAADNPDELQQYHFADIARDLGVPVDEVRSAISDGGYNGITFGVRRPDREALARYKRPSA
ncbi:MAG: hypothetical protein PGN33_13295 [Methylobacterium radiotolerans]